jgi:Tfp pilus assembly protein PilW
MITRSQPSAKETFTLRNQPHRGFTLVELMVAMTGALALSASVFMVAKHATAFYQQESRAANANLASIIGFERLRADLARAGFMASPNIKTDARVCGSESVSMWPPMLNQLQSVTFGETSELPDIYATVNDLHPQEVIIAGNFTSGESIPIRSIERVGSNVNVSLQVASGAMARLGYSATTAKAALLGTIFPTGRIVRIVDRAGRHHYGLITGVAVSPDPIVVLSTTSAIIQFRDGSTFGCGINGNETGATINTVNFIRYRIGEPATSAYDAVIKAEQGPAYDADRRELLRVELDPTFSDGTTLGAEELIAEYAMDLQFRVTVESALGALSYVETPTDLFAWAGPPPHDADKDPRQVRSIHAWLSVRSREADRASDIPVESGPRYRVKVSKDKDLYARLRTVQSRIALHNQ